MFNTSLQLTDYYILEKKIKRREFLAATLTCQFFLLTFAINIVTIYRTPYWRHQFDSAERISCCVRVELYFVSLHTVYMPYGIALWSFDPKLDASCLTTHWRVVHHVSALFLSRLQNDLNFLFLRRRREFLLTSVGPKIRTVSESTERKITSNKHCVHVCVFVIRNNRNISIFQ